MSSRHNRPITTNIISVNPLYDKTLKLMFYLQNFINQQVEQSAC